MTATSSAHGAQTDAPSRPELSVTTCLVVDHRPVVRAGLRAVLSGPTLAAAGDCDASEAVATVTKHQPDVVVIAADENSAEPYRVVAAIKAVSDSKVLMVASRASAIDLREAVIAGVDSFLLMDVADDDLREAVQATARGERVVSPEVAMQLASAWHRSSEGPDASLTPRELDVLRLLAEGMTNQAVANDLGLSPRTVKTHVQNLLSKLDVPDRTGAVARGFRLGLIH